jgi:hypothetical protein
MGGSSGWMKYYCRPIGRALIGELVVLIENSPRGSDTTAKRMIIFVSVEGLVVVLVKDVIVNSVWSSVVSQSCILYAWISAT